jgi:hypothetical protein
MPEKKRFYQRVWFTALMLVFLFPIGAFLLWKYHPKHKIINVVFTLVFGFFFLIFFQAVTNPSSFEEAAQQDIERRNQEAAQQTEQAESVVTDSPALDLTDDILISATEQPISIKPQSDSQEESEEKNDLLTEQSKEALQQEEQNETSLSTNDRENNFKYVFNGFEDIGSMAITPEINVLYIDSGILVSSSHYHKKHTFDYFDSADSYNQGELIYVGELNKDEEPDGEGIIFKNVEFEYPYEDRIKSVYKFIPYYYGNFKKGQFHGQGVLFEQVYIITQDENSNEDGRKIIYKQYEGEFSNGKKKGKGYEVVLNNALIGSGGTMVPIPFISGLVPIFSEYFNESDNFLNSLDEHEGITIEMPIVDFPFSSWYEGDFNNDLFHGNGTLYNAYGSVQYDGRWDKGNQK